MQVWNVLYAARWKYRTQKFAIWAHRTNLSGYIFATKACIDNRKKIVKQQYRLHMSSQYGELRPTSGWDPLASFGYPSTFQRVDSVTEWHSRSELCVVEQRAPPIFGRAAITLRLGISPHSSSQGSVATLRPVRSLTMTSLLIYCSVPQCILKTLKTDIHGVSDVISLYHIYASCFHGVMWGKLCEMFGTVTSHS